MPFLRGVPSTRAARASSTVAASSARACFPPTRRAPPAGCTTRSARRRALRRIGAKGRSMARVGTDHPKTQDVLRPQKARGDGVLLEVRDLARFFDVSRPWRTWVMEGARRQSLEAGDGVPWTLH